MTKSVDYSINDKGVLTSHRYNEGYFSDSGGYEESHYVFLKANHFEERCLNASTLVVGELGFGTGLNFLISWQKFLELNETGILYFISCEKYLLKPSVIKEALKDMPILSSLLQELLDKLPKQNKGFHLISLSKGRVKLLLLLGEAEEQLQQLQAKVDIWYLDGFSPKKNPDMWTKGIFYSLARLSTAATTYGSFTAASSVRKNLQGAGFSVEKIKGFGFKRHMIRGQFEGYVKPKVSTYPYFKISSEKLSSPNIAIVGGGLAGTSIARVLSSFPCTIDLYEKSDQIAPDASGNSHGMALPILAKKEDIYADFTLAGLTSLLSWIDTISIERNILEFATNQRRKERLKEASLRYDDNFISYQQVKEYSELEHQYDFIEHKEALVISPKQLCINNINASKCTVFYNSLVEEILAKKDKWLLMTKDSTKEYDIIILANSNAVKKFNYTKNISIRPVRGQLINIPSENLTYPITKTLNYMDYLIPHNQGYLLGATFDVDSNNLTYSDSDSIKLLTKLNETFPNLLQKDALYKQYEGRVSLRAVTLDYFPIVGQVADYDYYQNSYIDLHHGLPNSHYPKAKYHKNLYVAVGYGARGLLSCFLSAEFIASQIFDLPLPLPEKQLQKLHTARFWIRKLKKNNKN